MTIYFQRVDGLEVNDPVQFRDYEVGTVKDIDFAGDHADSLAVKIKFDDPQFRVHCSSMFMLISNGLLGGMIIDITPPQDSTECFLKKGAKVSGSDEKDFIEEIIGKLSVEQSGELKLKFQELFQDSTKKHLFQGARTLFANINAVGSPLQQNMTDIRTGIQELQLEIDSLKTFLKTSAAAPIVQQLKLQQKNKTKTLDSLKTQLKHLENEAKELKKSSAKLKTDFNRSVHEYKTLIKEIKEIWTEDSIENSSNHD